MDTTLATIVRNLGNPKILVLGDIILDRYIWGNVDRVSPEAPVLVLCADDEEVRLGGAASVANLLRSLDAQVVLAGVIGDDSAGRVTRALLTEAGIDASAVICDSARITTSKDRFIGRASNRHPNQILRVDREVSKPVDAKIEESLTKNILERLDGVQALLISDYAKGTCTPAALHSVIAAAKNRGIDVFVDPARIADYRRYHGATLLVPNRAETETALGVPVKSIQEAIDAGRQLSELYDVPAVLIKLDRDGMAFVDSDGSSIHVPAEPRAVYDVTGAGDMVLAAVGICKACGVNWDNAIRIANIAAGLEVERHGVSAISRAEICADKASLGRERDKVVGLPQLVKLANEYRRQNKRIVFTNGCFDLLHVGHVTYLQEAAFLGDVLVVAVNSDSSVRRLKGPQRPVLCEKNRMTMLAALGSVDHVVVLEEDTPHEMLRILRPECLVKGGTYTFEEVGGHEIVTEYGGQVRILSLVSEVSTTRIISDVVSRNGTTNNLQTSPPKISIQES